MTGVAAFIIFWTNNSKPVHRRFDVSQHTLEELFADFKPHGKGREFEDLDVVMKKMEHWAHRLFPKLPFNSVLDIIANRLGKRKV